MRAFLRRIAALFRKKQLDDDLDAELRSHLEMAVEANLRKGMPPEDARREALLRFGGVQQVKELCRDQRKLPFIETFLQDLRFGFRMLMRNPGFSFLAILCLTLGIGANAAVFSWIEGILLRPYAAVANQDRMYALSGTANDNMDFQPLSWPDFKDYQQNCTLFESLIVSKITGTTLSIGDRAERAGGSIVSANYFEALGIRPILGRAFSAVEETGRNAHPVTVISYQMWMDRFGGDRSIIGKTQILNGIPHTIIGVAPEGFYGTFIGYSIQFWVPASMEEIFEPGGYKLEDRGARWIEGFGVLKPGVSQKQAQEQIAAVAKRLEKMYPETNRGRSIRIVPLWLTPFNGARTMLPALEIVLAVVIFVLLIVCANVGNLLLVRSFARDREMSVRLALGSGRGRLVKQLLTEGLILSTLATMGGILIAYWCRNLFILFFQIPGGTRVNLPGEIDWRVLAVSGGVSIVTTLLFALFPALHASKIDLAGALKSESGSVIGARGKGRVRSSLVLIQVALSFVLLVGAGLLMQSTKRISVANPGFSTSGVLSTALDLRSAGYDQQRARIFQDELMDRLRTINGIESAVYSRVRPFSYLPYSTAPIKVDRYIPRSNEVPTADYNEVAPEYFATLGVPLISGREFRQEDDEHAPLVAIVNQTMAARFWGNQDPVGKLLGVKDKWMKVIGVAKDAKYSNMLEKPMPFFYVPLRQNPSVNMALTIRTSLSAASIAPLLTREIHSLDPGLAPQEVITMREQLDRMSTSQKVAATLITIFSFFALSLSAIGLYAVMSCSVSQGTREFGLRMALGAGAPNLLRKVLSSGLVLTAGGIVVGAVTAFALTRWISELLYQVSPRDPLVFGFAMTAMILVACTACFVPAWRAARIDPARALRN